MTENKAAMSLILGVARHGTSYAPAWNKEDNQNMDYESCKYFTSEDTTPWHGDAYGHPSYRTACTKSGMPRTLPCPVTQCARCKSYVQKDTERTN